jgi:hypothetical protein
MSPEIFVSVHPFVEIYYPETQVTLLSLIDGFALSITQLTRGTTQYVTLTLIKECDQHSGYQWQISLR